MDSDFDPKSPRLKLIAGDASDRKFYRYYGEDNSYICMQFPAWSGGYGGDPLSWLGMHSALNQWKIPLPDVVKVDADNACIWTSDLGDNFLNRHLGASVLDHNSHDCQETLSHYRQALSLLVRCQYPESDPLFSHPARERFFDSTKLLFELDFFGEHFLTGLLGRPDLAESLRQEWNDLAQLIGGMEQVLCHRDYHARNLMLVDDAVFWIDFQDARMGPHSYDVVSLLRDSYVKFSPQTRDMLFAEYLMELNMARSQKKLDLFTEADFYRERLLVGLQRNIKALGSFAYLFLVKKKKVYLSFVKHTVDTILLESKSSELPVHFPLVHELISSLGNGDLQTQFASLMQKERLDQF